MLAAFYLLPLLLIDTGSAMLMMIFVIPVIALLCSAIYGIRQGFHLLFPIITMILFAPTIIIFYNLSAWVYIVAYGGLVLVGSAVGTIFHKEQE